MPRSLRYTLVTDGPSDRLLAEPINWLLRTHASADFASQWVDLRWLPDPPRGLPARVATAIELHPCELLFIHRDAENSSREHRISEIRSACAACTVTSVCVVPVRMQEAWFLFNESAIREASGNPSGRTSLSLPRLRHVETLPDPKHLLHQALKTASGLSGRRLRDFHTSSCVHRLARLIDDYSPLRGVPAFASMERDLLAVLNSRGWARSRLNPRTAPL